MKLILIALLCLPVISFARTTIEITSFQRIDETNNRDSSAEICGVVRQGRQSSNKVLIISDPGHREAHYVTSLSPRGRFCHVIRTLIGRAEASVLNASGRMTQTTTSGIHSIK